MFQIFYKLFFKMFINILNTGFCFYFNLIIITNVYIFFVGVILLDSFLVILDPMCQRQKVRLIVRCRSRILSNNLIVSIAFIYILSVGRTVHVVSKKQNLLLCLTYFKIALLIIYLICCSQV